MQFCQRSNTGNPSDQGPDKGKYSVAMLLFAALSLSSCGLPSPQQEAPRDPVLDLVGDTIREGEELRVSLSSRIPKPEYKADRLNPERYKDPIITYECVRNCPKGLQINRKTGEVSWTPGFDAAGVYRIGFSAIAVSEERDSEAKKDEDQGELKDKSPRASIEVSDKSIKEETFIVLNSDRPASLVSALDKDKKQVFESLADKGPQKPGSPVGILKLREGETSLVTLIGSDPDGEAVTYRCASGCPAGMEIDSQSGLLRWTTDYDASGDYSVSIEMRSMPSPRLVLPAGFGLTSEILALLAPRQESRAVIPLIVRLKDVDRPPYADPKTLKSGVLAARGPEGTELKFRVVGIDPDGDPVSYFAGPDIPAGLAVERTTGVVTWTPPYDVVGSSDAAVRFKIILRGTPRIQIPGEPAYKESEVQVNLVVDNVNRPPRIELGSSPSRIPGTNTIAGQEGQLVSGQLLAYDDDGLDILSYHCLSVCPDGLILDQVSGAFSWVPSFEQSGVYSTEFAVRDDKGGEARTVVVLDVAHVNRPPRISLSAPIEAAEGFLLRASLSLEDDDVEDAGRVRVRCLSGCSGAHGVVRIDEFGGILFTPSYNAVVPFSVGGAQSAALPIELEVDDSSNGPNAKITTTVSIIVRNTDRAPSFSQVPSLTVAEENFLPATAVLASDLDFPSDRPAGFGIVYGCDSFSASVEKLGQSIAASGCPSGLAVDSSTGALFWRPTYDQAGDYSIVFFARGDGLEVARATGAVRVTNVNRLPSIQNVTNKVVNENGHTSTSFGSPSGAVAGRPLRFFVSASDPDGESLTYSCVPELPSTTECPSGFTVSASGLVDWLPSYSDARPGNAPYVIRIRVSDPYGGSAISAPFNLTVFNVDRPPVARLDDASVPQVMEFTEAVYGSFLIRAEDPDGDSVSFACADGCPVEVGDFIDPEDSEIPNKVPFSVGAGNGEVRWTPGYRMAKQSDAHYSVMIRLESQPQGFQGDYLSSSITLHIKVKNKDRAPAFVRWSESLKGNPAEAILEVCEGGHARIASGPFTGLCDEREATNSPLVVRVDVRDPDSFSNSVGVFKDSVSFECVSGCPSPSAPGAGHPSDQWLVTSDVNSLVWTDNIDASARTDSYAYPSATPGVISKDSSTPPSRNEAGKVHTGMESERLVEGGNGLETTGLILFRPDYGQALPFPEGCVTRGAPESCQEGVRTVVIRARSVSAISPGHETVFEFPVSIRVVNTDRRPRMLASEASGNATGRVSWGLLENNHPVANRNANSSMASITPASAYAPTANVQGVDDICRPVSGSDSVLVGPDAANYDEYGCAKPYGQAASSLYATTQVFKTYDPDGDAVTSLACQVAPGTPGLENETPPQYSAGNFGFVPCSGAGSIYEGARLGVSVSLPLTEGMSAPDAGVVPFGESWFHSSYKTYHTSAHVPSGASFVQGMFLRVAPKSCPSVASGLAPSCAPQDDPALLQRLTTVNGVHGRSGVQPMTEVAINIRNVDRHPYVSLAGSRSLLVHPENVSVSASSDIFVRVQDQDSDDPSGIDGTFDIFDWVSGSNSTQIPLPSGVTCTTSGADRAISIDTKGRVSFSGSSNWITRVSTPECVGYGSDTAATRAVSFEPIARIPAASVPSFRSLRIISGVRMSIVMQNVDRPVSRTLDLGCMGAAGASCSITETSGWSGDNGFAGNIAQFEDADGDPFLVGCVGAGGQWRLPLVVGSGLDASCTGGPHNWIVYSSSVSAPAGGENGAYRISISVSKGTVNQDTVSHIPHNKSSTFEESTGNHWGGVNWYRRASVSFYPSSRPEAATAFKSATVQDVNRPPTANCSMSDTALIEGDNYPTISTGCADPDGDAAYCSHRVVSGSPAKMTGARNCRRSTSPANGCVSFEIRPANTSNDVGYNLVCEATDSMGSFVTRSVGYTVRNKDRQPIIIDNDAIRDRVGPSTPPGGKLVFEPSDLGFATPNDWNWHYGSHGGFYDVTASPFSGDIFIDNPDNEPFDLEVQRYSASATSQGGYRSASCTLKPTSNYPACINGADYTYFGFGDESTSNSRARFNFSGVRSGGADEKGTFGLGNDYIWLLYYSRAFCLSEISNLGMLDCRVGQGPSYAKVWDIKYRLKYNGTYINSASYGGATFQDTGLSAYRLRVRFYFAGSPNETHCTWTCPDPE